MLVNKQLKTCILFLTLIHVDSAVTETGSNPEPPETLIEITDSLPHDFTSPDFPRCCKPMTYLLRKRVDQKYLKLLFTDVDLPPISRLLIYGLKANGTEKVPLSAASYINGAWVRPVVLYEGREMLIEFLPAGKLEHRDNSVTEGKGKKTFVGFNATFWADNDNWELDKPFTHCPPIADAVQGGKVTVKTLELPLDPQHYRFYCVWLLKPVPDSDLQSYVNLESLSGMDSTIKIHSGLTSASPVLYSSSQIATPRNFTSNDGFYIELAKPATEGNFTMTYGVFKTLLDNEVCTFKVDGMSIHGFKCEEGNNDLCIPEIYKCDKIKDCPSGLDESNETCYEPTPKVMTTESPTTNPSDCPRGRCKDGRCPRTQWERCPEIDCGWDYRRCGSTLLCVKERYQNCPGDSKCALYQITCPNGTCVSMFSNCPGMCGYGEKRCRNGKCVAKSGRCPEDPCPYYKPLKCDEGCRYKSIKCDGVNDCVDGADENNCRMFEGSKGAKNKLFYLFVLGTVPFICCVVSICMCPEKFKRDTGNAAERQRMNPTNLPVISGPSPGATTTRNTQANTNISSTTVISNDSNRFDTNSSQRPSPFQSSNPSSIPSALQPQSDQPQSDQSSPSAPPSYGDVMNNRDIYVPLLEPPPSYSSISSSQV